MPDAINPHERDFEREDDVRTVKRFADAKTDFDKLKAQKKRFAAAKKTIDEEITFLKSELGIKAKPSK